MTFHQFVAILRARMWSVLLVLVVTVATVVVVSYIRPTRWTATASVLVDSRGPDPVTGILLIQAQTLPAYMATQVDVIQSRNVALKVVNALRMDEQPAAQQKWLEATEGRGSLKMWLADGLLQTLEVKPSRESSVVNIDFVGEDPRFAATVANAFAQAYIDTTLELKVTPARQQAEWFNERTQALRAKVEDSSSKLAVYQQEKGIVSLDERLDTENTRLAQYNEQLSQARARTADAQTRQRLARDSMARGMAPDSIPEVVDNNLVQALKNELAHKEGQLKDLSMRLGANYPQYQAAAAEVASLRQKLRAQMADVVTSLENNARIAQQREAELRAQLLEQKAKVLSLKKERDELAALSREAENAQKAFDVTSQRFNQTSLESQATQTNVAVLTPATEPLQPSSPKWGRNIALAVFLGAMLGVGLALLMEMLDHRVRGDADVTNMLQLPVLVTLPHANFPRALGRRMLTYRPAGTP